MNFYMKCIFLGDLNNVLAEKENTGYHLLLTPGLGFVVICSQDTMGNAHVLCNERF